MNGRRISEEEAQRRLDVLKDADTVFDAAQQLGIQSQTLYAWARNNYEDYQEEFGQTATHPIPIPIRRVIQNMAASMHKTLDVIENEGSGHIIKRRVKNMRKDLDYLHRMMEDVEVIEEASWTEDVIVEEPS